MQIGYTYEIFLQNLTELIFLENLQIYPWQHSPKEIWHKLENGKLLVWSCKTAQNTILR